MNRKMKSSFFGLLFLPLFFFNGCNQLSTETYDQLRIGMSHDEVISLLGKADECDGAIGIKNCTWGNENKHIKVSFAGDKVMVFSGRGL